jgi:hypothetical protein
MRRIAIVLGALSALGFASTAANAAPTPQLGGATVLDHVSPVEKAQFLFGGRQYCFYLNGWRGPGWYWCGYAWRRGYGWGGPRGWHNWREGGHRGGAVIRGGHGRVSHGHRGGPGGHGAPHGAPGGGHGGHGGGHGGGHHH